MKDKKPYHYISAIDGCIIAIQEDGLKDVWNNIEKIKNPFKRCWARNILAKAIKKMKKNGL